MFTTTLKFILFYLLVSLGSTSTPLCTTAVALGSAGAPWTDGQPWHIFFFNIRASGASGASELFLSYLLAYLLTCLLTHLILGKVIEVWLGDAYVVYV